MSSHYVPVVDLHGDVETAIDDPTTLRDVDYACRNSGFFIISDHGLEQLIPELLAVCGEFFNQDLETKLRVATPPEHLALSEEQLAHSVPMYGYQPPEAFSLGRTHERGTSVPDLRQNYSIAPMSATDDPNRWPERPAAMRGLCIQYYERARAVAAALRAVCARSLGLPSDWFVPYYEGETSTLTINYYASLVGTPLPGQLRAGAHTDFGGLTLLALDDDPSGLQIKGPSGEWMDIPQVPGGVVVNLGDLFAYWTGGAWSSTLHRVVLPQGAARHRARMSMPFFDFPNFDALIGRIDDATGVSSDESAPPVRAGDWRARKVAAMRRG